MKYKKSILIIDDMKHIRDILWFSLKQEGYRPILAENGQRGLDCLFDKENRVDLVILDVMMPIMDGYTAAIAIRNCPRTASLPILVVTAKSDMRHLFEAIPSVAGFFEKPFDPKALREAVAKAAAGK